MTPVPTQPILVSREIAIGLVIVEVSMALPIQVSCCEVNIIQSHKGSSQ
jgi:hypothetical protein